MQVLKVAYSTWKQVADANAWADYYLTKGSEYFAFTGHEDYIFEAFVDAANVSDFETNYKPTATSVPSKSDAYALLVGINVVPIPRNDLGVPKMEMEPLSGSKMEGVTQNFCDKRTWWTESTREVGVTLTDSGDGLTFNQPTPGTFVDVEHGRLTGEVTLQAYRTVVYVDGVEKTPHSPGSYFHYNASKAEVFTGANGDGDYYVNYLTGAVVFKSSQAGKTVTVDQSRVGGSTFYLQPDAGKRLEVMVAELQITSDTILQGNVVYQPEAEVEKHPGTKPLWDDASNPAKTVLSATYTWNGTTTVTSADTSEVSVGEWISLNGSGLYLQISAIDPNVSVTVANPNGYPIPTGATASAKAPMALYATGTWIPLRTPPLTYKTKRDLINEANASYPVILADPQDPSIGGGGWNWRQSIHDIHIYRWEYKEQAFIDLRSSWGMRIAISLSNDVEVVGHAAVTTFYGRSKTE